MTEPTEPARYPAAADPSKVGTYTAGVGAGGGYVWDDVLEYRAWCHPEGGAEDLYEGDDYFCSFATYEEALAFSEGTPGAEQPLALVLQREYIDEPSDGHYVHVKTERITEWVVEHLRRPRRTARTIPELLAPDAPANRLDVLRGLAPSTTKPRR